MELVVPRFFESRKRWIVQVPKSLRRSDDKQRRFFQSKDLAQLYANEVNSRRDQTRRLIRDVRPELIEAAVQWEDYFQILGYADLDSVLQEYADILEAQNRENVGVTLQEAWEHATTLQERWSPSKRGRWSWVQKAVPGEFWDRPASRIKAPEWEAVIAERCEAARSWKDFRGVLNAVYQENLRHERLPKNPIEAVPLSQGRAIEEVDPFTAEEAEALMRAAEASDPELVPALAFLLFQGVRPGKADHPGELQRLQWEEVDLNRAQAVIRSKSEGNRRRVIDLSEQTLAWIRPFQRASGPVVPPRNQRKRIEAVRDRAGARWGNDICRKSYATHLYALTGSKDRVRAQLGHADFQVLDAHYVRMEQFREDSERYFAITPTTTESPSA